MARQEATPQSPHGVPGARALRAGVAQVVARRPGPELVAGLLAVMGGDVAPDGTGLPEGGGLSARAWVVVAAGWGRVAAFAAAAQLEAVAALDVAPRPAPTRRARVVLPAGRRAADEVAPALGIAPQAASRLVALARRAAGPGGDLHRCHDALARGAMDPTQLRRVAGVTRGLGADASARVQDLAVRRAPRATVARLRAALSAEAHAADPAAAARAAAVGRGERDVVLRASPSPGCRRMVADLPTVAAESAWTALNAVATTARDRGVRACGAPEDRTQAQLRAEALTAALTGRADPADPGLVPDSQHLAALAEIQVIVTAEALLAAGPPDPPAAGDCGGGRNAGGGEGSGGNRGAGGEGSGGNRGAGGEGSGGNRGAGGEGSGDSSGSGSWPQPGTRGAESATRAARAALPATIPGAGILDAAETRRIAATTTWRRLVVDAATGTLLAYGRRTHPPPPRARGPNDGHPHGNTSPTFGADPHADPRWQALRADPIEAPPPPGTGYRPPAALRRHVHTRDATCAGPACFHTARGTQLDHTVPWARPSRGGAAIGGTTPGNLASLCRRSHNAKTHGGWTLTQPTPGILTWTSPTGCSYHRPRAPLATGWPTRGQTP